MTISKEMAERYGLTMPAANEVPPAQAPPVAAPAKAAIADRWSKDKRRAFDVLDPCSLVLVATDGPVSVTLWERGEVKRSFGHNRGIWPAKIAKTGSWRDTVSESYDRGPFFFVGAQFRFWSPTKQERDRLADSVIDLIAQRAEADGACVELENGFRDLGADLDLSMFEFEVHGIAERIGVRGWDDAGLSDCLDRCVRRAGEIAKGGQRGRFDPLEVAIAAELEAQFGKRGK